MRIVVGMAALFAALLMAWPALATEDEKGEAGDTEVGAVIDEGQVPPAATPPVEGAPPPEKAEPGEAEEGAESPE